MSIQFKSRPKALWLCAVALIGSTGFAVAQNAPGRANVVPQLSAFKVAASADGEKLVSADKIAPGEVIEYQVRYANTGAKPAKNLQATLPIPASLEWVPNSARPAADVLASLDGKTFALMPLMRKVKAPDGTEKTVAVPSSEYRFLRWSISSLGAGQSVQVAARARLAPVVVRR